MSASKDSNACLSNSTDSSAMYAQAAVRQDNGLLATVVGLAQKRPHRHKVSIATGAGPHSPHGKQHQQHGKDPAQVQAGTAEHGPGMKKGRRAGHTSCDIMRKTALRVLAVLGGCSTAGALALLWRCCIVGAGFA